MSSSLNSVEELLDNANDIVTSSSNHVEEDSTPAIEEDTCNTNGDEVAQVKLDHRNRHRVEIQKQWYQDGGSWFDGRVELQFNIDLVEEDQKQVARRAIFEMFHVMNERICNEGLFHRTYSQSCDRFNHENPSVLSSQWLGSDGNPTFFRIGPVAPVIPGYALYGRIDNVQLVVEEPNLFRQQLLQLIGQKLAWSQAGTQQLGLNARVYSESMDELEHKHRKEMADLETQQQIDLVFLVCEKSSPRKRQDRVASWGIKCFDDVSRLKMVQQQERMDLEHNYRRSKNEILNDYYF